MWLLLLLLHVALIEPVTSQDKRKLILQGDTPCEGYVEVHYNKDWGYVGDKLWKPEIEQVVCRSTYCGERVSSEDVMRPKGVPVCLNELECNGTEKHLWECVNPGWRVSYFRKQTVKKITCSSNVTFDLEGFRCAGVARYFKDGKPAGHFCRDGWGPKQYDLLCESLGCGKAKTGGDSYPEWLVGDTHYNSPKMKIDCSAINDSSITNVWQCVDPESSSTSCKEPAAIVCEGHKRLQIRDSNCTGPVEEEKENVWVPVPAPVNKTDLEDVCRQMHCGSLNSMSSINETLHVECTDKVEVVLTGNQSKCYGEVHITVNGTGRKPVCGTLWTANEAKVVCRQLGCGKVISASIRSNRQTGKMDSVKCSGNEASLWHCQGKHEDSQCQSVGYVTCSDSIQVKLMDGLSKCSGRLMVKHEGKWKRVKTGQNSEQWPHSNIVCKMLNCGEALSTTEKFCKGDGDVLDIACTGNETHISECSISNADQRDVEPVAITCKKNEFFFLKGNTPCSGEVWKKVDDKDTRVSVLRHEWNKTYADELCEKVNCGSALNFAPKRSVDRMEGFQNGTDVCSPTGNTTCDNTTPPSTTVDAAQETVVDVTCTGKIKIDLTRGCWGHVNLQIGKDSGSVCGDTWTEEMSKALCKQKGCGDMILTPRSQEKAQKIIAKSVHKMDGATDVMQFKYIINNDDDKSCLNRPAYVVCSGSIKSRFQTSRDRCSGNVEVHYDGEWLPVCMDALTEPKTRNVICRELECGDAIHRSLSYFGPKRSQQFINTIDCPSNGAPSLSACNVTVKNTDCVLGGLQCSEWMTVALEVDESCSGQVIVHSKEERSYVSTDGWTPDAGKLLCKDMNCGKYKNFTHRRSKADTFWNGTFSCEGKSDKPNNIWDCETQKIPSNKEKLYVECEGEPKVKLSHKCYGDVKIDDTPVCEDKWKADYSHMVCQEQTCGNAINYDFKGQEGEKYYVSCDEHHYILGQCKRAKGNCPNTVSVLCIGGLTFNTTEYCGGEIKMNYGGVHEKVCYKADLSPHMKDDLCRQIGCDAYNVSETRNSKQPSVPRETFKWSLQCSKEFKDVKHCFRKQTCETNDLTKIYCNGYVPPVEVPDDTVSPVTVVIGVGLTLLILIIIFVFVRFYMIKRSRKSRVVSRMLSGKEVEFESGEYEDVMDKSDEMEDFVEDRRGRFRSEGESFRDRDRRSVSSLNYDDIDVENEGRPLNARDATDAAWEVENVHQDGVTYEVDDPQESYDDIEGPPETTETKAEVHDGHEAAPESNAAAAAAAAAAPEPAQGGGDYLVPGQDG